ncbi:MAG: hypothetical protein R2720_05525 [Candidatus Nanopelagicales bacterium]
MNDADSQNSGSGSRWEPTPEQSAEMPTERLDPGQPTVAVDPAQKSGPRITSGRARTVVLAASAVIVSAVAGAAVVFAVVNGGDSSQNDTVGPQSTADSGGRYGQPGGGHHGEGHHR